MNSSFATLESLGEASPDDFHKRNQHKADFLAQQEELNEQQRRQEQEDQERHWLNRNRTFPSMKRVLSGAKLNMKPPILDLSVLRGDKLATNAANGNGSTPTGVVSSGGGEGSPLVRMSSLAKMSSFIGKIGGVGGPSGPASAPNEQGRGQGQGQGHGATLLSRAASFMGSTLTGRGGGEEEQRTSLPTLGRWHACL